MSMQTLDRSSERTSVRRLPWPHQIGFVAQCLMVCLVLHLTHFAMVLLSGYHAHHVATVLLHTSLDMPMTFAVMLFVVRAFIRARER